MAAETSFESTGLPVALRVFMATPMACPTLPAALMASVTGASSWLIFSGVRFCGR